MRFRRLPTALFAVQLASTAIGMPQVAVTAVSQHDDRTLSVDYTMGAEPGVVTMDVETLESDGSWKGVSATSLSTAMGAVNRLVTNGTYRITWRPDDVTFESNAVFDPEHARIRLTAWPTNNPPDYMVVDLCASTDSRVRFYVSEEALPGGLLANPIYRESAIVLRRMHASGVPWTMGDLDSGAHAVVLDADYYIGVFELTQLQYALANDGTFSGYYNVERMRRPCDRLTYNNLRGTTGDTSSAPEENTPSPTASSFLGKLARLTGVDFEMPTEAQWEFAARAGTMSYEWPTGVRISISGGVDANVPGRYNGNGGMKTSSAIYGGGEVGPTNATAIVGSYAPNRFGLYDMCGNVQEWCRDWFTADISALNGACVENRGESYHRVLRGGSMRTSANDCRPTARTSLPPHGCIDNWGNIVGYRPCAPCCAK